ncbi:MAG: cyclic nucleotide-binding domain-containing protein [Polyangiaceae bacterium]
MLEARLLRVGREMFLAALGLPLETVDSWVIDRLTAILDEQRVRAGQTLFTSGEPAEFVYFMQDGQVRFGRAGGHSWTFQGRWVLGGFEVLGDRPSSYTAVARTDFYAMRVRATPWVELFEDSFQLARSAVVNAARAVARIDERVPQAPPTMAREASPMRQPLGNLGLVDRLALLLDVAPLRGAGVQALADLAATSQQVSFGSGQIVIERGVQREQLVRVVEGVILAERAEPTVVRHYRAGDLVCGAAIIGGAAEAWEAKALTPTVGIAIPIEALFDLMEEHFDLVRSTMAALGAERELLLDRLASASGDIVVS